MKEDAPQREYSLRTLCNAVRSMVRAGCPWRMMPNDLPPWFTVPQQTQRWIKAGCFAAMAAFADQGDTGDDPADQAAQRGVRLVVVKLEEAKKGLVLLPRRWVVERSFAWCARFRRLARDYQRLPSSLAGLHGLAFLPLMLNSISQQKCMTPSNLRRHACFRAIRRLRDKQRLSYRAT